VARACLHAMLAGAPGRSVSWQVARATRRRRSCIPIRPGASSVQADVPAKLGWEGRTRLTRERGETHLASLGQQPRHLLDRYQAITSGIPGYSHITTAMNIAGQG
jgi:hypothetical protein